MVCCLAIPADMSVADFCNFCGAYLDSIRSMRVLRREARLQVVCMVLIRFSSQEAADDFYHNFNLKPVSGKCCSSGKGCTGARREDSWPLCSGLGAFMHVCSRSSTPPSLELRGYP